MNKLQVIKFVVAILTFLLVFGLLAMMGILYKHFKTPKRESTSSISISLQQPRGSNIAQILVKDGYLHVLIKDGGKADRIVVLDKDNQSIYQEITLQ